MAKKYLTIGSAWLKDGAKGQYISGIGGNKQDGYRLVLKNDKGEELEVTTFAGFFNEKKSERQPDLRFVMSIE